MKYIQYKEHRQHGTNDFPFAFYPVTPNHPRYHMLYHWHTQAEIIRILSGTFTVSLDGTLHQLSAGDILFISPGSLHGGTPDGCQYECLVFDMNALFQNSRISHEPIHAVLSHDTVICPLIPKQMEDIHQTASALFQLMAHRPKGYQLMVPGYLYVFFGSIFHHRHLEASPLSPIQRKRLRHIRKVLQYMNEHFAQALTLQDLADCAGMNSNYFCRFFKSITMKTPIEYLNYYRIECACEQLLISDKSIACIAMDCGFNDVSYFVKVFKKFKQTTPSQFVSGYVYQNQAGHENQT